MEDSVRSDGIVKKKSSSGCLIIKKKGQGGNGVGVGIGSSKEKKRPRMIMSDSGSSDEGVEVMRRKTGEKIHNWGVGFRRSSGDDRGLGRKGEFKREKMSRERVEFDRYNEFGGREVSNEYRKGEFEHERKIRNNFEFDKYNEFRGREVSNEYRNADGKLKMGRRISGGSRDFGESGSWRNSMVQKRKHAHLDGSNSVGGGRSKGVESGDCMSKRELDDAEAQLPISLLSLKYQETPDKPIRLQGKNGVLKVMVNSMKKKKTNNSYNDDDRGPIENRKGPRVEVVKKDLNLRPPLYSESKRMEKQMSTNIREENMSMSRQKLLGKRTMDVDLDLNETDTSLKLAPPSSSKVKKEERSSTENCISVNKKGKHRSPIDSTTPVSGEEGKKNSTGSSTPAKGKEGKVKGGGSTEKQKLRETIREMLLEAGWTIDYRPRRNRDYLDSVYINPSGTAYWSIIKAYDALQKQFNGQKSRTKSAELPSSFAPLSEDLISKLTRQTRKKIEEKMKKRREDGMSKNTKKSATKESEDAMDSDQPEETPYSWSRKNLKSSKDNMQKLHHGSGDESSDDTCKQMTKGNRVEKSLDAAKNRMAQGIKSRVIGRCILRVRDSNMAQNSESDGYVPYFGKRTVLAWLVNSGIVQSGEKVQYMNRKRTRVKLEGWITKEGIHCGCCSKILTVAKFELHAGSKLRRPFPNIFLESGVSLLQCQIDAWNRQEESERKDFYTINVAGDDPDDDACGTCGDGGDLICCDSCPSTFHQSCLEIKMLPEGDWHCPNCVCKFCGTASRNDSEDNLFGDELTICNLCERKFHKSCSTGSGAPPVDSNSADTVFCGQNCQEIYDHVHNILGVKHDLEEGFSWSLIQRTDMDSDVATVGFAQRVECNSKLAVALSVMNECFLPISDRRSGINIIHNVFYNCGANFQRLNYRGFYTAVLERGDEIISVASIRIHGTQLAEMPFIGTRHIYRRQGMCRRLLSAIELVLSSFKVEKLIIPAISEHMHTWTEIFDFNPLEEDLKREIKSMNMLVFPGTDMLQKQLMKTTDVGHLQPNALARKSSSTSSAEDEDEGKDAKVLLNKKLDKCDVMSGLADSAARPPTSLDSLVETASDQAKQLPESTLVAASKDDIIDIMKTVDPLNKDHVQSQMETEPGDVPEGIVNSFEEDISDVAKRIEDPSAQLLADLGGGNCVPSTVVSDEVDIQSTPYEVTINDHDMTNSAFDNIQTGKSTDENVSTSPLEDAGKYSSGSLSSDLNIPGGCVKDNVAVLVSNTEVATDAEVASNLDGSDAEPISFEHAPASVDLNASGGINEESVFFPSACGETINSRLCVKMSEIKSEPDMKVSPAEAIPDSINVCLSHDVGEKHQEIIPVPHKTSTDTLGENCVHSTIASDEVDVQSTPYSVAMKDHDMTDNIHTGKSTNGNNSGSNLEDAGKYSSGGFSSNLHKPGVGENDDDPVLMSNSEVATDAEAACVEGRMDTSSMYEVSNRDGSDAEPVSSEHAPASEFCVKMSEMKSELPEASGLGCEVNALTTSNISNEFESNRKIFSAQAVSDSIDVRLPYGAGEAHKNQETIPEPHNTMRVDAAPILHGIPEVDRDPTASGSISSAPILQGIPEADSHPTASGTISREPILQGIPEADSDPTVSGTISSEVFGSIDPNVQSNNPTASRALSSELTGSIEPPVQSNNPTPSRAFSSDVTGSIEPPDQSNEKSNEVVPVGSTTV